MASWANRRKLTATQGSIYAQIIERVINESKDAFAEEGVALDTLDEMKEVRERS